MAQINALEGIEKLTRQMADFPFDGHIVEVFPESVNVKLINSETIKRNVPIPDHIPFINIRKGVPVKLGNHLGQPMLLAIFPQLQNDLNYAGRGSVMPNPPALSVVATRNGWLLSWPAVPGADRYRVYRNDTADETTPDDLGYTNQRSMIVPYESPYRYFAVRSISGLNESELSGWMTDSTPPPVPTGFDVEDDIQGHRLLMSSSDAAIADDGFKCWEVQQADSNTGTNTVELGQMGKSDFPRLIQCPQGTTKYYRARAVDFADNASAWTDWQIGFAIITGIGQTIQDKFDTYGGVLSSSIESLYWLAVSTFETGENWTAVSGLTVAQTAPINEGAVSLSLDCNAGSVCRTYLAKSLNLSDENRFTNDDYVSVALNISDNFGAGNFYLVFANSVTMENYYSYQLANPTAGRYHLKIKKSEFVASGSPNWATITHVFISITNVATNHTIVDVDDLRIVKADPDDPDNINDTGRSWDYAASTGENTGEWHIYEGNRTSEPKKPYSFGQVLTSESSTVYYLAHKPMGATNIVSGTVQVGIQLKSNGVAGFTFFVKDVTDGNWNMYGVIVDTALNLLRLVKWVDGTITGISTKGYQLDPGQLIWLGVDFRDYEADGGRLKVYASLIEGNLIQASRMVISAQDTQWLGDSGGSVGLVSQVNCRFVNFVAGSPSHADVADVAYALDGPIVAGETRRVVYNRDNNRFDYSDDGLTFSPVAPITSAARPGVTRLYRRDVDSGHNVQTLYDGTRWLLQGYNGDVYHAPARVAYADLSAAINTGCCVYRNSAQSMTTGAITILTWTGYYWNPQSLNWWNGATRLTAPSAGWYIVGGECRISTAGGTNRQLGFLLNGQTTYTLFSHSDRSVSSFPGGTQMAFSMPVYLDGSDYIELFFSHEVGSNQNCAIGTPSSGSGFTPYFMLVKI